MNCARFLWVHFQLLDLCDAATDLEVRETLWNLPEGMIATYTRILEKIARTRTNKALAQQVFKWIVCAKRPMSLAELAEAVAFKSTDTFWSQDKVPKPERLYEACGNLVVINEKDKTVRLAHHTVQQFLLELPQRAVECFHIPLPQAEIEVGEICVAYLLFSDFERQIAVSNHDVLAVSRIPEPKAIGKQATSQSSLNNLTSSMFQVRNYFRSHTPSRPVDFDFSRFAKLKMPPSQTLQEKYLFLDYAIQNWIGHTLAFSESNTSMWGAFRKLALDKRLPFDIRPWNNINELGKKPYATFIQWAASAHHLPLLKLLPQNFYIAGELFLQAIRNGNPKIVELMATKGADLETKGEYGQTALHWAAENGHTATVELLMNQGADFEAEDQFGETALQKAIKNEHMTIVEMLLANKTDLEAENEQTLLFWAVQNGHAATVDLLVAKGANLEARDWNGSMALHYAAINGHTKIVQLLLSNEAYLEAKDEFEKTALHYAAEKGHTKIIELLMIKGASLEAKTLNGSTALHYAVENGHTNITELLMIKGANLETKNLFKKTALHYAAENGHTRIVELLIIKGANLEAKDMSGETALHYAAKNGHTKIVELLMSEGADIHARDEYGRTMLQLATENNHLEIIELLKAETTKRTKRNSHKTERRSPT